MRQQRLKCSRPWLRMLKCEKRGYDRIVQLHPKWKEAKEAKEAQRLLLSISSWDKHRPYAINFEKRSRGEKQKERKI